MNDYSRPPNNASQGGFIPIIVILAAAGIGLVIDQLVNHGEVGGILFDAFFKALGVVTDGLAKIAAAAIDRLPNATDLGLSVPTGVIQGYTLLDGFLPLHEAIAFGAIYIGALLSILGFRIAILIYHLIPKPLSGT